MKKNNEEFLKRKSSQMYLIDGRLLSNKKTGIHRYTLHIIESYQEKYGHDNVIVIINKELLERPFRYKETSYKPFNLLHFFLWSSFLKKIDFDVYHSCFYSNSFFKIRKKIYITTVHDLMYRIVPSFFSENNVINTLAKWYYDFIVGRSLHNSDIIFSVSNTTKNDVRKFGFYSEVCAEGVNELENSHGDEMPELLYEPNSFFLYVGNFRPHKNIDFLIKAFSKSNTTKMLLLAGNANGFDINHELGKKIMFLGYLSDEELAAYLKTAAAFIYPSKYEGFGLPVLEALSHNCKVICSNAGALREFNSNAILYFNPNEEAELIKHIEGIDEAVFLEHEVRRLLKSYSWGASLNQMHSHISKFLAQP